MPAELLDAFASHAGLPLRLKRYRSHSSRRLTTIAIWVCYKERGSRYLFHVRADTVGESVYEFQLPHCLRATFHAIPERSWQTSPTTSAVWVVLQNKETYLYVLGSSEGNSESRNQPLDQLYRRERVALDRGRRYNSLNWTRNSTSTKKVQQQEAIASSFHKSLNSKHYVQHSPHMFMQKPTKQGHPTSSRGLATLPNLLPRTDFRWWPEWNLFRDFVGRLIVIIDDGTLVAISYRLLDWGTRRTLRKVPSGVTLSWKVNCQMCDTKVLSFIVAIGGDRPRRTQPDQLLLKSFRPWRNEPRV